MERTLHVLEGLPTQHRGLRRHALRTRGNASELSTTSSPDVAQRTRLGCAVTPCSHEVIQAPSRARGEEAARARDADCARIQRPCAARGRLCRPEYVEAVRDDRLVITVRHHCRHHLGAREALQRPAVRAGGEDDQVKQAAQVACAEAAGAASEHDMGAIKHDSGGAGPHLAPVSSSGRAAPARAAAAALR